MPSSLNARNKGGNAHAELTQVKHVLRTGASAVLASSYPFFMGAAAVCIRRRVFGFICCRLQPAHSSE